jgi:hypothetical protein
MAPKQQQLATMLAALKQQGAKMASVTDLTDETKGNLGLPALSSKDAPWVPEESQGGDASQGWPEPKAKKTKAPETSEPEPPAKKTRAKAKTAPAESGEEPTAPDPTLVDLTAPESSLAPKKPKKAKARAKATATSSLAGEGSGTEEIVEPKPKKANAAKEPPADTQLLENSQDEMGKFTEDSGADTGGNRRNTFQRPWREP